ncbi:hypothetical protein ABT131_30015 [Streptomyces sp900105245]|uniref:DUF6941 family protein n=1 Tax=Streptomyces sp. 900105245 TaxID=3154379 RepID=UPI00332310A4
MKLIMAALCDRATIREGLLHILGAGVTQCTVAIPGAADLDLAILIRAENWEELAGRHTLQTTLRHQDGTQVGAVEMGWEAPTTNPAEQDQPLPQLPVVAPLRNILLTHEGEYHASIAVDGTELGSVHFNVTKMHLPGVTVQLR